MKRWFILTFALAGFLGCEPAPVPTPLPRAESSIVEAIREERSNVWLTTEGTVVKRLPDDRKGNPHQRFLIRVAGGTTVLVAHNIELAPRVPLNEGDQVELRGEYEWNEKGGVLHWTHHDPKGRHQGGWIRHDGQTYR